MFGLSEEFKILKEKQKEIRVSIVGVGQMGRALVAQMYSMAGIKPIVVVDHVPERAEKALIAAGVPEDGFAAAATAEEADRIIAEGKIAVGSDDVIATDAKEVQVVIDATGATEGAARIALNAFKSKKHIVMMTVETDVTVGPILSKKAEEAGVIFTGMAGDEPGVIMELYDFAKTLGLKVLALGKGKNNAVDYNSTPDTVREEAESKEMNPYMLASFKDCTKTMVELCAVCNATGFAPDCVGCHGIKGDLKTTAKLLSLKSEGGILDNYGVVDYVNGLAPGVFAIVTTDNEEIRKELKYLSMGDGPNYIFYRPYHLCSLEVPITVGRLMLYGKKSLWHNETSPNAEVVAFAKRDLKAGEKLDRIGGYTVYGVIDDYKHAASLNSFPVGLANENTVVLRDVKKGERITYADVAPDKDSVLYNLRMEQDEYIKNRK